MTIKSEFINRQKEVGYFENEYKKSDFRFISIIGRRRLGKTRFISEFLKDKTNFSYILVPELNDLNARVEIAKKFHQQFGLTFLGTPEWDDIFEQLFQYTQNNQIIVVFDEFQRFLNINKNIFSIIQKNIDQYGQTSKMFLVVSGSSIGMMHGIFDHASPLYGRRTGQLEFESFDFFALNEWFPDLSIESKINIYSIYGGTPKYLEEVESSNILQEITRILDKTSMLYNEPEILLKTEISDSNTYFNILKNISQGVTKPTGIANNSGIKPTSLDYYLNTLVNDLDLVKREIPVTEKQKSKKVVYQMKDNFFRFWFRFVYPYLSEIEIGNTSTVVDRIQSELNTFVGNTFEEITKQFLIEKNKKGDLGFTFGKIGKQWGRYQKSKGKNTYEIDLAALNENTNEILFCECKWQNQKIDVGILKSLIDKSKFVDWHKNKRIEYFAVVSKSGFTENALEFARENNFMLFTLDDFENIT
ncbi:DUF234 DEXX-box ATPase [Methanohalobium evestigatum Z-7303]|uniref:DUF234 DEXX-box ATPase n=1 Tax=Methanohalobium evestigatum (strain ATCC BAA-1072 / DSM 3721 / NBRC 107634 / OCM 161 / Z-7303) TaxID=644295 RepID=D7E7J7_METEZ|nr:ATP-binding protein [Methanohalobium evestigatum]ADI74070.1 DUF234 DEXX-box ATPase [Methanohalobium evestigatum Z-7303]